MKIIDTHSHFYSNKFHKDMDEVVARAQAVCEAIVLPNIDMSTISGMLELTANYPDFFYPTMGLHPTHVKENYEEVLEQMKSQLDNPRRKYYAIGETGLDLYWDKDSLPEQQRSFAIQIKWAKEYELPIILHARDAVDQTTDMIADRWDKNLHGVVHAFDGDIGQAMRIAELGTFKIGIGGPITYRKDMQQMLRELPLEHIVLETDSPYLSPEPHRRDKPRRNESSYTKYICQTVAELHNTTYDHVAEVTNRNAKELFGIGE